MEDQTIIDLYWQRDQGAIAETEAKYGAYCHSIAFGVLRSSEDAEECVSDTWLRAWNAIPPERPRSLRVFLGRIVRNLSLDRLDYNRAGKRDGAKDELFSELIACVPDQNDHMAQVELKDLLSRFLRQQPRDARNIFLRRYWYCDSVEEIARRFGLREGAIKSSLFRTRAKLRKYLEKEGIGVE